MRLYTNKQVEEMYDKIMQKEYKYKGKKCKIIYMRDCNANQPWVDIETEDGEQGMVQIWKLELVK